MKILLITSIVLLLLFVAASADVGDPDTTGIVDTLDLVVTVDWDNNIVIAEVYCFTDDTIKGSSIGFNWGNSTASLTMDSAKTSSLLDPVTLKWLYEDDNIATTNINERFLLGMVDFGPGVPPDASGRRLWASYYFTMLWGADDWVRFDTLTWDGGSTNIWTIPEDITYSIYFASATSEIFSDMSIDSHFLNFNGVENCSNPPKQFFTINSNNNPLPFTLSYSASWLTLSPTDSNTPAFVDCYINHTDLTVGTYVDTVVIDCEGAWNSPQYVEVNFELYPDIDEDCISDEDDNCINVYNPGQGDTDGDGIGNACCCVIRGDVVTPNDGLILIDDLVYLVDFLFRGGDSPGCPSTADCAIPLNGTVLVDDILYLVDYLFKDGPAPPEC